MFKKFPFRSTNNCFIRILFIIYVFVYRGDAYWNRHVHEFEHIGYGPFDVHITSLDKCRGPKHADCNGVEYNVTAPDKVLLNVNITLQNILPPMMAKVIIGGESHFEQTIESRNVCHHHYLRQILEHVLLFSHCELLPGWYQGTIDVNETAHHSYNGRILFPGNYTVKSMFYTSHCNVFCVMSHLEFIKNDHHRLSSFHH